MQKLKDRYGYSIILLKQLIKTDFKLRYQGSAIGYAWSLLRPLFIFLILYIVFAHFLKVGDDIPHYPVYLLIGIVLWNYFAEITTGSVTAIVGKGNLIRKINFPKYNIILAVCANAIINLLLNFVVVSIFMAFGGVGVSIKALLVLPLVLELTILALGAGFALSALYVKFRDVVYIWEVFVQAMFYATPILYPLTKAPEVAQKYLLLNPAAQIIQDVRHVLVTTKTVVIGDIWNPLIWLIPVGMVLLVAIVRGVYFRSRSKFFAEDV